METTEIEFQILPPAGLGSLKKGAVKLRKRFGLRHSFAIETTARALGFPNYYKMRCALSQIEPYCADGPLQQSSSSWSDAQRQRELLVVQNAVPAATDAQVQAFVDEWALARDGLLLQLSAGRLRAMTNIKIEVPKIRCDDEINRQFVPPSLDFALQKVRLLDDVLGRQSGAFSATAVLALLYNYKDWCEVCVAQMTCKTSMLDEALPSAAVHQRHFKHVNIVENALRLEHRAAVRVVLQCRPTSNSSVRIEQRAQRRRERESQFEKVEDGTFHRQPGKLVLKKAVRATSEISVKKVEHQRA